MVIPNNSHIFHLVFSLSGPSLPLGKSPLGYQQGVSWISINNTGWARLFPSTLAYEMFSYQLTANHCWWLFWAINQFSWSDRIKQRHKYISRQDRRVCTRCTLQPVIISGQKNQWNIWAHCFPGKFRNLYFFFLIFLVPHCVSTPSFLFNHYSDKLPSPPWATSDVLPWGQLPWAHPHSQYICYVCEWFWIRFLLARPLGAGFDLEKKAGALQVGEQTLKTTSEGSVTRE